MMMMVGPWLGATWSNATAHPEMLDPACKGGIVRWGWPWAVLSICWSPLSFVRNIPDHSEEKRVSA
jgi:hypothetical protein